MSQQTPVPLCGAATGMPCALQGVPSAPVQLFGVPATATGMPVAGIVVPPTGTGGASAAKVSTEPPVGAM